MITTAGSRPSMRSMAEFNAWTMFICAMASALFLSQLLALLAQMSGQFLEDIFEHERAVEARPVCESAVAQRFFPRCSDVRFELREQRCMPLLGPLTEANEMLL